MKRNVVSAQHCAWAAEAIRGYCRYREHGLSASVLRRETEPRQTWEGQPVAPEDELEPPADLDHRDWVLVLRELEAFTQQRPWLAPLGDLVYWMHREGQPGDVEDFRVAVPFDSFPKTLRELGLVVVAKYWICRFELHLARVKAGPVEPEKEKLRP